LSKIPWIGKKLFTSTGIVERKTDLIIQITPTIVVDAYTGITKSDDMIDYENYVIGSRTKKESKPEMEGNDQKKNDQDENKNENSGSGE
jgi:type II secretory pathway component GspD/PulD (secretin)